MANGKPNQVFPAVQADDAFVVTVGAASIADDPNNVTNKYGFVMLKNNTAVDGTATVIPAHGVGTTLTVLIKSGMTEPLAVRQVTASTIAELLGYVGHQKI